MALNSFTTIKSFIINTLEENGIDDDVDNWIALAEADIYRELRVDNMKAVFSGTISSGVLAEPSDFKGWSSVWLVTNPIQPLEPKNLDWVVQSYPNRSADSRPLYIATSQNGFEFGPYPDSDYSVAGTYFAKLTALSAQNETNFLTTHHPDLLLYGALQHSAPFLGEDARLSMWVAAYERFLRSVKRDNTKKRFGTEQGLAAVPG